MSLGCDEVMNVMGAIMNEISARIEQTPESPVARSTLGGTQREEALYEPGS